MITFIHPFAFMWLLLAVPLVLFYVWRTRRPRTEVVTGALWRRAIPLLHPRRAWQANRWFVSLLLQLLTLLILVTALAEPCWRRPQRVAVVLDCTASMSVLEDGKTRADAALEQAQNLVDRLAYNDSMAVIVVSDGVQICSRMSNDRVQIKELLKDVPKPAGSASIEDAVSMARSLITAATNGVFDQKTNHVILISDGCFPRAEVVLSDDTVRWISVGKSVGNVEVEYVSASRRDVSHPENYEILAMVRNHFTQPVAGTLALSFGGTEITRQDVTIPPVADGGFLAYTFTGTEPTAKGVQVSFVAKNPQDDQLAEDNSATGNLLEAVCYRVLLVTAEQRNTLLESALRTLPGVSFQTALESDGVALADRKFEPKETRTNAGVREIPIVLGDRTAEISPVAGVRTLLFAPSGPVEAFERTAQTRDFVLMPWLDGLRNGISTAGVGFTGAHEYQIVERDGTKITPWLFSQSALGTVEELAEKSDVKSDENFAKGAKTVKMTELAWGIDPGETGNRAVLVACDLTQSDWLLADDFPRFLRYTFDWLVDSPATDARIQNGLEPAYPALLARDSRLNVPPAPEAAFTLPGEDIVPLWTLLILILIPACTCEWALYQRRWLE